ncbi:polysaccharide biosynthesis protein [Anaerotalea alkaliphila]|uniref:Polysaccharide biosynthesis protein n=1 Tax=Anaerotalea alkaliphila TaxID=2662126 RepID=A0A7X5HY06_9FIRM|nr:nucleoside-diphosphate sugar epimerase/dehydratase [Anaerotalea alkaliphila]NDL68722.1 polysaccharide biosynthesis protein [Anaerotalea alkaliphila]
MKKLIRICFLLGVDMLLVNLSVYGALLLRFEGRIEPQYLETYLTHLIPMTLIKVGVFYFFRLYKSVWRYASIDELVQVGMAAVFANTLVMSYFLLLQQNLPRSVYIITALLDGMLVGGFRMSYRLVRRLRKLDLAGRAKQKRVLVVGAGDAGAMIIREMKGNEHLGIRPVAIIDDNRQKEGMHIHRVPVVGQRKDIPEVCEKLRIQEIVIAIPSADRLTIRAIVQECEKTKCKLKILPGVYDMMSGKADITSLRNVRIEDLLGRDEIKLDMGEMGAYITGKRVMVTGGGGSIGSELARQIAKFSPAELVLVDIYENNVYDLQNELKRAYRVLDYGLEGYPQGVEHDLKLRAVIASVRDEDRMDSLMGEARPHLVFHAAAHKHVPLMEHNPKAAVKNNVFGTYNVASAASRHGVGRFVLISTDKAVNPTNIMGATKRMCEMVIQTMDKGSDTEFAIVRFGNVLGSNGSVVPLFKRQIEEQGYVTVTHPEIIRYFMTIPEAARLVVQAGAMARGGEVFILDMGEPVKIVDLARDVIRLSGYEPEVEIPIKFTGLRPGEKLFEELLMDEEGIQSTRHEKIFIGRPGDLEQEELLEKLEKLRKVVEDGEDGDVKRVMKEVVGTYREEGDSGKKGEAGSPLCREVVKEDRERGSGKMGEMVKVR